MKTRSLASVALGAAVILGTVGCGAITPQATTIDFSPSDGVNVAVPDGAPVQILNALLVKNDGETDANFVAALVNDSDSDQTVTLSWDGGSAAIEVPAGSVASYGADESALLLQNVSAAPGATEEVVFQSGGTEGVAQKVQVFDTELAYLSTLAPTPPAAPAPGEISSSDEPSDDETAADEAEH
ncbi:DNA modification methylase [Microbacterium halotolerans]|uniref:DNA modification methylase n=1 Tax=Microbacterium halotolerans TaxID=246613 RepID=UPI0013C3373B|nr:DNA modification methylase [Microbacterium halotolerans]